MYKGADKGGAGTCSVRLAFFFREKNFKLQTVLFSIRDTIIQKPVTLNKKNRIQSRLILVVMLLLDVVLILNAALLSIHPKIMQVLGLPYLL